MSNDSGLFELMKQRQQQLAEKIRELERKQAEMENIETYHKEMEAIKVELREAEREHKEVVKQLENEEKRTTQTQVIEAIAQAAQNIQKATIERETLQTVGIAEKLDINHTISTDPISLVALGTALVGTYVADKVKSAKQQPSEKDPGKAWLRNIQTREVALKEKYEKQLQILAHNKAMQESQLRDSKKEGYETKLGLLENVIDREKEKIDQKFKREQEELNAERVKLEKIEKEFQDEANAIKADQQKTEEQKNKEQDELETVRRNEIELQRSETERERQIESGR